MAERLSLQFRRLLEERKLQRIQPRNDIVLKEVESAEYDLRKWKNSLEEEDYKWAIIQAYYSMFHAARALIYSKGYRERSHRACLVALKEFFLGSSAKAGSVTLRKRWICENQPTTAQPTQRRTQETWSGKPKSSWRRSSES